MATTFESERLRPCGKCSPGAAEAEKSKRASAQPVHSTGAGVIPRAGTDRTVEADDVPGNRQDEREGVVGKLVHAVRRRVRHDDACARSGRDVDLVESNAVLADDAAALQPGNDLRRAAEVISQDAVRVLAELERLGSIEASGIDHFCPDGRKRLTLGLERRERRARYDHPQLN